MQRSEFVVVLGVLALLAGGASARFGPPTQGAPRGGRTVELPSGSVDGLAGAIAQAGPHGVVLVRAGLHTESGTVTIEVPVRIVGEEGAVLEVDTCPDDTNPLAGGDAIDVDAALHVRGASHVGITGLEIRPTPTHAGDCLALDGVGGTAILVEGASHAAIHHNVIRNHQAGIILEQADHASISANTIAGGYPFIGVQFVHGILVANGDVVHIAGNDISATTIGLWACDRGGKAVGNVVHGNLLGLFLCNVPPAYLRIDGQLAGAEAPASGWLIRDNDATGNFDAGYMVTDGSSGNLLLNNSASSNGLAPFPPGTGPRYDIEIVGWTDRFFGMCTPPAYGNIVILSDPGVTVNDCGSEDMVMGGDQITPSQCLPTFGPCPP